MHNKIVRIASSALTGGKLLEKLKPLTRWEVQWDPNKTKCLGITREVTFKDYETTWAFLTRVSMRSHLWGHHPLIHTSYTWVKLELHTHDIDPKDGAHSQISDIDVRMAKRIDSYIDEMTT
ncbi:putative pterin-4-alpha-carbinolamine dehydratase [Saccharomyces cerevisiae]|nr:putative pterin-4-alpha-carbinolamine dehydratase [Saccharomyces cerevisiae]GFP73286.1 putative pterin-4-alpha-carbinolamine dehydratase [Saccharomyces cerevisiae]